MAHMAVGFRAGLGGCLPCGHFCFKIQGLAQYFMRLGVEGLSV